MQLIVPLFVLLNFALIGFGGCRRDRDRGCRGKSCFDIATLIKSSNNWKFDESKSNGQRHWGKKFPACRGKHQSPIDINTSQVVCDDTLTDFVYGGHDTVPNMEMSVSNVGEWSTIVLKPMDDMTISGNGLPNPYLMTAVFFRFGQTKEDGSQHAIDGKYSALEVIFAYFDNTKYQTSNDAFQNPNGVVNLVVLFEIAGPNDIVNEEVGRFSETLGNIRNAGENTTFKAMSPMQVWQPSDRNYYRYEGSIPVPPCTESLTWFVFKEHLYVSEKQMENFRLTIPDDGKYHNSRYPQPLNDRVVTSNCATGN